MKNIFLAYRFTGEDLEKLKLIIDNICNRINNRHSIFCSIYECERYEKENFTDNQIMEHCYENFDKSDLVLFFIKSDNYSNGMDLELERAVKQDKNRILFIKSGVEKELYRNNIEHVIEYSNYNDLYKKIEDFKFSNISV